VRPAIAKRLGTSGLEVQDFSVYDNSPLHNFTTRIPLHVASQKMAKFVLYHSYSFRFVTMLNEHISWFVTCWLWKYGASQGRIQSVSLGGRRFQ